MKRVLFLTLMASAVLLASCTQKQAGPETVDLFNGKDFTGWKFVVSDSTVNATDIWSIKDGVVQCAGVPNGYMITEESYSNYKLHLEWRWTGEPTNSGVLLHCGGELEGIFWPNCFECQLMSGKAGDFVIIGPGQITVDDSTYINPSRFAVIPKKHESNEKPAGEWNAYDIEVRGNAVACYVNGLMQNNGVDGVASSGPIGLQSEGSPIEFRNIQITPLEN